MRIQIVTLLNTRHRRMLVIAYFLPQVKDLMTKEEYSLVQKNECDTFRFVWLIMPRTLSSHIIDWANNMDERRRIWNSIWTCNEYESNALNSSEYTLYKENAIRKLVMIWKTMTQWLEVISIRRMARYSNVT